MLINKVLVMKLIFLFCSLVCIVNCNVEKIINDNLRVCKLLSGDNLFMFEVFLGMGWDNFVNEERGMVINLNYF